MSKREPRVQLPPAVRDDDDDANLDRFPGLAAAVALADRGRKLASDIPCVDAAERLEIKSELKALKEKRTLLLNYISELKQTENHVRWSGIVGASDMADVVLENIRQMERHVAPLRGRKTGPMPIVTACRQQLATILVNATRKGWSRKELGAILGIDPKRVGELVEEGAEIPAITMTPASFPWKYPTRRRRSSG